MRRAPPPPLLLAALALLLLLTSPCTVHPGVEAAKQKTHYDVLELQPDATLQDIKKAYRKLAVQHHPDRNPGNEEEATERFRDIAEAYEVLSDEGARRDYDRALKFGRDGAGVKWSYSNGGGRRERPRRRHRDPFAQFNDVFQNDPFFADAFKGMDDLFEKHFANNGAGGGRGRSGGAADQPNAGTDVDAKNEGSWIWNKVKDYMPHVNVQVKTSSNFGGGGTTYSSTSHSFGGNGRRRSSSRSSYTSRSTRTTIENGQRVTIQSLEKDGNKIEEKYVGDKLIERKINGLKENIGRIDEF
ncbi:hypothetical protein ACHAXT_011834 [Thalassiosira profunda]